MHEAALAETDDWWTYPNGRQYYTPLRAHMKEVVEQLIEEAEAEGFMSTRKKPGREQRKVYQLDPLVCQHCPEISEVRKYCLWPGCSGRVRTYCPGCARDEGNSGFYCMYREQNCMAKHHRKRARTPAPDD